MRKREPEPYEARRLYIPFEGQPIPQEPLTWGKIIDNIFLGICALAMIGGGLLLLARIVAGLFNIPIFPDQVG